MMERIKWIAGARDVSSDYDVEFPVYEVRNLLFIGPISLILGLFRRFRYGFWLGAVAADFGRGGTVVMKRSIPTELKEKVVRHEVNHFENQEWQDKMYGKAANTLVPPALVITFCTFLAGRGFAPPFPLIQMWLGVFAVLAFVFLHLADIRTEEKANEDIDWSDVARRWDHPITDKADHLLHTAVMADAIFLGPIISGVFAVRGLKKFVHTFKSTVSEVDA